jgi:hypothetical protein
LALTSCSSLKFTKENIAKVHQGMSSTAVQELFGEPDKVRVAVCGRPPDQWTCTTWEYSTEYSRDASFTFSGESETLRLNNYDIKSNGF